MFAQINEAVRFIQSQGVTAPQTGIILGTGLGRIVKQVQVEHTLDYADIPHFVEPTVESHRGKLVFGKLGNRQVVVMSGRFHFYEGYTMQQITFPVRVMKMLGISELLVSNACGALNQAYKAASLMLLDDHINFLPTNPLVGPNISEMGVRFPDMSSPYDKNINGKLKAIAQREGITLHEGVYAAWIGPSLETRAEYRFLRMAGADVVGMSTVPEVIVANHMKLPVVAISVVTDLCDPDNLHPITLDQLVANASLAEKDLTRLFTELLKDL
ncbi:MAG: purine-nucleoside phosphorylase [Bacteroidetes bacterium]|nr:purine-nucleoside phosphorylase [Bacteroidota bacterium]